MYENWKTANPALSPSPLSAGVWRALTLIAVTVAWVPFRAATLSKAGAILSSMFYRFGRGSAYSSAFYAYTIVVVLFCALEPVITRTLAESEERAGQTGPSSFRIIVRPLAYALGLLLFLLFDQKNPQFIYSQF
jgi:hypothetical protein